MTDDPKRSIFDTPASRRALEALEGLAAKKRRLRSRRKPTLREACEIILKLDDRQPLASLGVAKEVARQALEGTE